MSKHDDYLAALGRERENVLQSPVTPEQKQRVADIDAEIRRASGAPEPKRRAKAPAAETVIDEATGAGDQGDAADPADD